MICPARSSFGMGQRCCTAQRSTNPTTPSTAPRMRLPWHPYRTVVTVSYHHAVGRRDKSSSAESRAGANSNPGLDGSMNVTAS